MLKTPLLQILAILLVLSLTSNGILWFMNYSRQEEINKLNVNIGVTSGLSQNQEVRVIESKRIEEKIHVVTNEKLKIVKEYVYDTNKSDCENGMGIIRNSGI
jgi:hypothetical protein